jgi:hypothetical protein
LKKKRIPSYDKEWDEYSRCKILSLNRDPKVPPDLEKGISLNPLDP